MVPCLSITNPLPVNAPVGPLTFNCTTDGSTFSTRSAKSKALGPRPIGAGFDSAGCGLTEPLPLSAFAMGGDVGVGAVAGRASALASTVGDLISAATPVFAGRSGILLLLDQDRTTGVAIGTLSVSLTGVFRLAINARLSTPSTSTATITTNKATITAPAAARTPARSQRFIRLGLSDTTGGMLGGSGGGEGRERGSFWPPAVVRGESPPWKRPCTFSARTHWPSAPLRIGVSGPIKPAVACCRNSAADIGPWTWSPTFKNHSAAIVLSFRWRHPLTQMSSGHLSVPRRQRTAGPCFAAGLQPSQPARCLKATILGGRKQSPLARTAPDRRQGPRRPGIRNHVHCARFPPSFAPGEGQPPAHSPVEAENGRIEVRHGIGEATQCYEALARITAIRSCKRSVAAAGVAALYRFSMAVTSPCAPAHGFPPRRLRPWESSQRHNARGPHAGFWAASIKNQIVYCSAGSWINNIGSCGLDFQPNGQRSRRDLAGHSGG